MNIQIFGERHSGTKFVANLCRNFLDTKVVFDFGHKHFFNIDCIKEQKDKMDNTLFLCVVRNPYSWLNGMWDQPYHTGVKRKKQRYSLLTSPWWSVDTVGKQIKTDVHIYNNRTYQNMFELRTCKLIYLKYTLPRLVKNFYLVRSESLLDAEYINIFLSDIKNNFDIKQTAYYDPKYNMKFIRGSRPLVKLIDRPEILKMINHNLDWNLENSYNYYPIYNYHQPYTDLDESVYTKYKEEQQLATSAEKREEELGSKKPLDKWKL